MPKRNRKRTTGNRQGSLVHDALFYDPRMEALTFSSFRLLMELVQQYNGFNNGNLSMTPRTLRFDWNAKTVKRSKHELLNLELIEVTRFGVRRRPTLYALCHLPINEIKKHGILERQTCTHRATGNRTHFYPVKKDLVANVTESLMNRAKVKG